MPKYNRQCFCSWYIYFEVQSATCQRRSNYQFSPFHHCSSNHHYRLRHSYHRANCHSNRCSDFNYHVSVSLISFSIIKLKFFYSITEYTSTVTETPAPGEPQTVTETITAAVGTLTVTDFVQSCETPSPTVGTPSTSSPASTPSATSPVSLNGECGGAGGQTCLGSAFGNCCSGKVQECI